ncbi:beta-N-acetylhexosaminidase [Fulvimarina sp. 2208YS6-2-32]|uniref:beta-N-acetylhexosaminidase n=1 Tax=Fulvimarina uroteuthidis TaxID=3098149 RepID=A0ABU5I658_9HYPH|nr:beta-N-acetylhexosaminidase [Fulvimarina sp. 2208YS6-2-32]MDY8110605.1 beta-N-acetylhexosaminidase [Fulvimarina sp. 2208YS6-2-32]
MSDAKAWIAAPLGFEPSRDERHFFEGERPWGFILFARNIDSPSQLGELVEMLKELGGRETTPIFIDQEGGRIQRLKPPFAPMRPAARALGDLYREDRETGLRLAFLHGRLLAGDLMRYGINADCIPCLDVPVEGAHDIIGDRALSDVPADVARLGRAMAQGCMAGGVLPVMKHIPGHGRGRADSHKELPVVTAKRSELAARDFLPFAELNDLPCAMSAHILFTDIDDKRCATLSPIVIEEVIRGEIGFDGLLMTDDISMKALTGAYDARAEAAIEAGCDVVLHCNGDMDEMRVLAKGVPILEGASGRRAARAEACLTKVSEDEDIAELSDEYDRLMAVTA